MGGRAATTLPGHWTPAEPLGYARRRGETIMQGRKQVGVLVLSAVAAGLALGTTPARGDDEIDAAMAASGKVQYERYCTSCHGKDGEPGKKAKSDLRTYVARHGGKFPAADWLSVIADVRPGGIHAPVWERIQKSQGGANPSVTSRAVLGQIARYVNSIQAK
jgi:mono/diheme cytochrome c family protein